ncbi:MAG: aldo/keto reductase [Candidatus Thorarchaeota archaeon]
MNRMRLGKTELKVSRLGFGGIPITRPPEDQAIQVIRQALESGVNFIDTAYVYGSEEVIGKAIAGQRDKVILATKTPARDRETAFQHLEESLRRLDTDYIDLWQFHNPNKPEDFDRILGPEGAMEAAKEGLETGKVRHIGFTTHSLDMALKMTPTGNFETIMFPFNFVTKEAANQLVALAKKHDVGFLAMKPFAGGQITSANLAIKYLLQFENVLLCPGIEKIEELKEIISILDGPWNLTSQEIEDLDKIRDEVGTQFCRRCDYCMPCLEGVSIPTLMILPTFWQRFSPTRFFAMNSVRSAVESADACIECGECEEKCPYDLPIRDMIKKSMNFYENLPSP